MKQKKMFDTVAMGGFNKLEVIKYVEVANAEKESGKKKLYEEKENTKRVLDEISEVVKKSSEVSEEVNKVSLEIEELQKKMKLFAKYEEEISKEIKLLETKIANMDEGKKIYSTSEDVGKIIIEANVISSKIIEEAEIEAQSKLQKAMIEANDMIENEEEKVEGIKFSINENLLAVQAIADEIKEEYYRMNLYFKSSFEGGLKAIDEIIDIDTKGLVSEVKEDKTGEIIELQLSESVS